MKPFISIIALIVFFQGVLFCGDDRVVNLTWDKTAGADGAVIKVHIDGKENPEKNPYAFVPTVDDLLVVKMIALLDPDEKIDIEYQLIARVQKEFTNIVGTLIQTIPITKDTPKKILNTKTIQINEIENNAHLIIRFLRIDKDNNKSELDKIVFRTKKVRPKLFASTGVVASLQLTPTVSICKTSNLITFEQNGVETQEYEKEIREDGLKKNVKVVQSLVQFVSYQILNKFPLAVTIGLPLNTKFYEDPYLGLSVIHWLENNAFVITLGVHLPPYKRIAIGSGFETIEHKDANGTTWEYYKIDPLHPVTLEDIPMKDGRVIAYFLGISFKF